MRRCLRRHGVSRLQALKPKAPKTAYKPLKAYEPGYLHIDVKYLPQMNDEERRLHLFVPINRAARWLFVRIYPAKLPPTRVGWRSCRNRTAWVERLIIAQLFGVTPCRGLSSAH